MRRSEDEVGRLEIRLSTRAKTEEKAARGGSATLPVRETRIQRGGWSGETEGLAAKTEPNR
jgi:hypothetical protein